MGPWDEILCITALAGLGAVAGYLTSKLPRPFWWLGYFLPLFPIVMVGAGRWTDLLNFIPPFSWLMQGRTEFVILAISVMVLVMTLVPHLPRKPERVLVLIFSGMFVAYYTIFPFIDPILVQKDLEGIETYIDADGVCHQSTLYTCGPASAVSALHWLGVKSSEGQLAIQAFTCPSAGTAADLLCEAIQKDYDRHFIVCQYRSFSSLQELREATPAVVQLRESLFMDHFVAVLKVTDTEVVLADPLDGLVRKPFDTFEKVWRYSGITFKRNDHKGLARR